MLPGVFSVLEKAKVLGHIVVHIQREEPGACERSIKDTLAVEVRDTEPAAGALEEQYLRARSHQFYVPPVAGDGRDRGLRGADELFEMLARIITNTDCPGSTGLLQGGCIVSIASESVMGLDIRRIEHGATALELRVDLLKGCPKREYTLLRGACSLPILWTVRSKSQGGSFSGTGEEYAALVQLGAELGADLIDVECVWPAELQDRCIAQRRTSRVISSYFDTDARCRLPGTASPLDLSSRIPTRFGSACRAILRRLTYGRRIGGTRAARLL